MKLSSGDVCEVAGVTLNVLDAWCTQGVVQPLAGGNGHGKHREFSVMQTVGIALVVELRKQSRGCVCLKLQP